MKNKHRIKQGLSLLLAGGIALTNLGAALPAFAEDAPATPETASAVTPETAEADTTAPNLVQITENLYNDLPDAPTGSYLGSMGLPVATGETKIGISAWVSDLYDGVDAHMDADALNADENTVTIGKTPGTDYAIVPLLAQVEYPADSAVSEIILPDGVELLSYRSTDYEPIPADEQEQAEILHHTYSEQSAAATGLYVKASADFTAQLVYTDSDGSSQSKSIHVQISEDAAPTQMYADTGDDGIAAYAAGPTPPYATGKITSIAKEGGTWLIWFNGQEAYCCSHGLNGQPKGCPTYGFSHVSRLEPGQYTPGNHYANQVNIWGGLGQLSLDMLDDRPVVASLEDDPEGGEEQPDILGSLYDETQQWIMKNYPDSYAAQTYIAAAEELVNGTDAQSGENGYYTYIYNPPAGYAWQVVALVGEEIAGGTEIPDVPSVPEPKYYSAAWTAPAQTAGGSFDLTFTVNTDKVQLNTLEKVDGAVITVTPSQTGGSVDGGSWQMTPAAAQTITTSGHTPDDSFHLNGGDGSATWTVHYEVSKTSTSTLSGQEGPFTSQAEADAAAEAAKNAAIGQLQNEAQGMVDAAIAAARAQLANLVHPGGAPGGGLQIQSAQASQHPLHRGRRRSPLRLHRRQRAGRSARRTRKLRTAGYGRFSAHRTRRNKANHTKNQEAQMKLNHNKKSVKISLNLFALYAAMVCGIIFALPAFAADDPLVVVENLSTFIFSLIRAVGLILLGWGIVQVGLSLQSHDPSQRSQGFLTLAGGLVITFAKEILDLITA